MSKLSTELLPVCPASNPFKVACLPPKSGTSNFQRALAVLENPAAIRQCWNYIRFNTKPVNSKLLKFILVPTQAQNRISCSSNRKTFGDRLCSAWCRAWTWSNLHELVKKFRQNSNWPMCDIHSAAFIRRGMTSFESDGNENFTTNMQRTEANHS